MAIMKSCIISLFLLLAVTGSWATLLHSLLSFGLQPPDQQFFYTPPQRNIAQEQFLFFPQLRSPFPNPYQSFNYVPTEKNPYTFYNPPAAQTYPFYPNYKDSYNPVVQYIYQQAPLESVPSNSEYGEKVPEPAMKHCNDVVEIQLESEVIGKQPEITSSEQIPNKETTNPTSLPSEPESTESTKMQEADVTVQSTMLPESDATSMENNPAESTTLA